MDLRDAYALAEHLLDHHGLRDWQVAYDSAKRRAGVCRFRDRTIGLSAPLTALHSEDDVRDTILHEIAHALAGPRHGHDATGAGWRRASAAAASGASPPTRRGSRPPGWASARPGTPRSGTGAPSG